MKNFEFVVASDVDYDKLIAEIYYNDKYVALINQDKGPDGITIEFPGPDQSLAAITRVVPLEEFVAALKHARNLLLKPK